ncbi:uncharacterized protein [Apostichopus japonicus]|uniref:uncharacterized protein isoform X2 n=1 Tax=Stichopus japonicus TaxID=307972 RepID=UPI003AB331CD
MSSMQSYSTTGTTTDQSFQVAYDQAVPCHLSYVYGFFHETDPSSSKMSIAFTKEMALAAGLLLLLVFFCTGAYGADANNKLVCKETYFLHYDITAVISCEYERSFLTVRWYFNGAGKSFLRFDGETLQKRGSGYDSGEYDIQDDGSMVIKRTDVKHEGIYKIAVLHSDGSSSQENIAIFIVVPLKSLIIHDCGSRRIELCPGELFEESSDAILCIAKDSWLPVDLAWQTLGPNGIAVDVSSKYTSVHKRDNISSLFTSSSTLQYEKESFVLQKFTCVASDRANKTTLTNSLLVSGDYPPLRSSLAERNVNEGSSFHMKCPVESKPLAQLYVTFFDGISKLLMETNTTTSQQVCVDESCQLMNDNIVVFDNVSHKQEGVYRCISSDGTTAEEHVLDVTVLISPDNAAVNIKGCASTESCTRNGTKPGSLTCSVSGFRPPLELTMTEDDDSKLEVKLTNHRRETTTDPESGTSESYLTVDYAIIGCDGTASLTCTARPDKFARKIKPSKITITTDKVKCMDDPVTEKKGKGGLIAGLLVVFAIIAVVFIVIRTRKKGICKSGGKQSEETENRLLPYGQAQTNADETDVDVDVEVGGASTNEKKEKQALLSTIENQETDMADTEITDKNRDTKQKNADETAVEVEKASFTERDKVAENEALLSKNKTDATDTESKDKKKDTKQKKVKTPDKKKKEKSKSTKPKSDKAQKKLQEEFNKKFRAIFEMESQVQKERFKDELDKFIAKHGKENTVRLLGVFVKDTQLQEEELIWILECLELEKEENVKSSTETVEILRIIAEKKQVSEKCLEIAKQQYLQKKITAREFATITSPLRESHKIDELLKSMDVPNKSQKEPSSDAVDALVQYAILKPLNVTEQHRNVSYIAATNAASKIKYINIVQAIHERFGEGNSVTELKAFLKTIAEKVLIREKAIFKEQIFKILEDTQPTKEEEITSVFVRMLLFSVEKKLIEIGECMEMLQSGLDKKKLTKSFFTELPRYSQTEGCLCKEFMFQILREAVVGEKITEVDCFRILEGALNEKQIQISEYMAELTQSVKDNLITKEEMMEELRRCAMENLENEVYYCYQMNYLLEKEQLTYKEYTEEIQSSVDNNWVKRSHVVEGLQDSLKNKLITEQQLLSQLCQMHVGGKISEHIEALQLSRTKNLISEDTLMSQLQELVKKGKLDSMSFVKAIRDCIERKLISETIFLQQLMLRLLDTTIDFETYRSQLESCIGNETVQLETYLSQLDSLWNDRKIEQFNYMGALRNCLIKNLMTTEGFLRHLLNLLKTNKLKYEEVASELKTCFKEKLVNDIGFFSQLVSIVKLSKKDLLKEHEACLRENLITTKAFTEQLHKLLETKELQIKDFVEGFKRCLKEKLIDIQFFLSTIHSDLENRVLKPELFAEQLFDVVKTSELDVTGYINEMRSCLKQGLINQTLFLKELRKVSESGKLNIEGLTFEMKNTLEKKLISQEEFCENLSYLFKQGKIDQPKIVEQLQVCLEKKWISEDMFLNQLTNLFVNKKMDTNDLMEKLHECVGKKSLREESFLRHVSSLFIGDKLAKHELMEEYLICLAAKLISLNVFCEQLRMLLKDKKIETGDYLDTLKIALERNLIDDKFIISTLRDCLRDKSVNEAVFLTRINDLFKTGKITRDEFVNEVKNCLKEKSISETTFFAQLDKLHDEKKYTIAEFTGQLENCVKEKLISEEQFCKKLNNLLEKRLLQLENLLDQLQNCFKNKLIQEDAFLGELTSLFTSKQMSREKLMDFFHKLVKAGLITKEGFFHQLKYLLSNQKLSKNELMEEYRNCVKTNLISMDRFCKEMDGLVSDHLIKAGDYLDTLEMCLENKLIQKDCLVTTLRDFLQQEFMDEPAFLKRLQNLCSKSVITTHEYIEELWVCLKQSVIPKTTLVAQIDSLLETKKIDTHGYFTELENCLHHKSISPATFCEKLNQLLTSSKVDVQGFIAEIQNCFLKDLIDQSTFFGQLKTKFVDQKISRKVLMEVYHACLQKQKISVNDYWNELFDMLKNGKISINDFVQELSNDEENEILGLQDSIGKLHGCRKENLMTEEALCTFLEDLLQKAKLDITEYNTELKKCVDANLISNEIYSKQIEQQEEKKKIDFREAFKALCTEITSDKGTNDKFQEVLKKFHKKYKESPSNYMEEYIDKEDIAEKQLIAVTKFLAECEESDLFTIFDRTKAIRLAVKKLPPETSLSLLAEIFSLHQITVEEFVAGTKFLLDEKKITAKGILATLKEVSKSKYPGVEIADTVIQFILKNLMNVDEVFRQIGFLGVGKEKIHHPYFLQAIQGIIGDVTVQQKNTLRSLFEKILTKAADNQVIFRDQAINKMKKPDLRKQFLRVLLLNVQNKWMKTDECIAILTASKQKGQINETDLEDISECLINQRWLDKVNTMDLLAECFHASLMSESTYKKSLTSIKKKGKITKDELADALKICAGKNT